MTVPYEPEQASSQVHRIEGLVVGFIVASILEAEVATALVAPLIGLILHAAIILTILNIYLLIPFLPHRKVLLTLLLLPILRLMSLTIPISPIPKIFWYAVIGVPLLFSTAMVINIVNPQPTRLLFRLRQVWGQLAFGLLGVPLGLVVFLFVPHKPFLDPTNWSEVIFGIISLTLFGAFTEELIFRVLIQTNLEEVFGRWGIWIGAILYAGLFSTTLSVPVIAFWGVTGLVFSLWVKRTQSIWGAVVCHSLILVVGLIVSPLFLH
jgi:uncharacterized protein